MFANEFNQFKTERCRLVMLVDLFILMLKAFFLFLSVVKRNTTSEGSSKKFKWYLHEVLRQDVNDVGISLIDVIESLYQPKSKLMHLDSIRFKLKHDLELGQHSCS